MDGSCGFPFENILSLAVLTVIDHEVPKGDVAGYKVVLVFLFQWSNGFKGLVLYNDVPLPIGMQGLRDACRKQVFLQGIDSTAPPRKGFSKRSHASRWIQTSPNMHSRHRECVCNGRNNTSVGIERGQHTRLDALPIPLGGVGIDGFTVNHLLEPLGRLKQMLFRRAPITDVVRIVRAVQYTLQTTEALITTQ